MSGGIFGVLQFAIDGVTDQQNAIANNLANAQTPDYSDTEVNFQQSLQQAIAAPGPATATETVEASSNPANTEGNNVDMASELVESEKSALQYQTISENLNAQFRLIAGASGGSYS